MKFENFLLATRVLKYISDHPKCKVPQIRDYLGLTHSNPPHQGEKDLYKVISYLKNSELINKLNLTSITPGGAHFYLITTKKGSQALEKIFSNIKPNLSRLTSTKDDKSTIKSDDLSLDFSKHAYEVLNELIDELVFELPLDIRRLHFSSKRSKINALLDKSHKKLQDKVSNMIDSLT